MHTFYEEPHVVKAQVDHVTRTMVVTWRNLGPHLFIRPCCEAQLEQVRKGARYLILDTSDARGVVSQPDQRWFGDHLFPSFARLGLRAIITVMPGNTVARLSSKGWVRTASPFSFDMYETDSVDDARRLVQQAA